MDSPSQEEIDRHNMLMMYERQLRRHPDWRDPEHPEPPEFLNENEENEEEMEQ